MSLRETLVSLGNCHGPLASYWISLSVVMAGEPRMLGPARPGRDFPIWVIGILGSCVMSVLDDLMLFDLTLRQQYGWRQFAIQQGVAAAVIVLAVSQCWLWPPPRTEWLSWTVFVFAILLPTLAYALSVVAVRRSIEWS